PRGALSCHFEAAPQRMGRTGPRPTPPDVDTQRTPALRPRSGGRRTPAGRPHGDMSSHGDTRGDGDICLATCGETAGWPTGTNAVPIEAGTTPGQQPVDLARLVSGTPTRELRGLILRYFLTVTMV